MCQTAKLGGKLEAEKVASVGVWSSPMCVVNIVTEFLSLFDDNLWYSNITIANVCGQPPQLDCQL